MQQKLSNKLTVDHLLLNKLNILPLEIHVLPSMGKYLHKAEPQFFMSCIVDTQVQYYSNECKMMVLQIRMKFSDAKNTSFSICE